MNALGDLGELVRIAGVVEGVLVALEQAEVGVHARALHAVERLGHERGVEPLAGRPPRARPSRNVITLSAIDSASVWRRSISCWLGESSWNEYSTGMPIASSVWIVRLRKRAGDVGGGEVEVRAVVERCRAAVVGRSEVEELHLRGDVEREARARGPGRGCGAAPGGGRPRRACRRGCRCRRTSRASGACGSAHGSSSKLFGVGAGEHVALLHPGEAVDRRAVERHALLEGVLQLGRADGEALQLAEHVGEPQPHEAHAALLDRAQDVVLLSFHRSPVSQSGRSVNVRATLG